MGVIASRMNPHPIHRAQRLSEWIDEDENRVNHILCPSRSPGPQLMPCDGAKPMKLEFEINKDCHLVYGYATGLL